jgi:hypothetical protein
MTALSFYYLAQIALILYAFARSISDLRSGRKVWGGVGLTFASLGLVAALVPVPSHVMTVTIPATGR